VDERHEVHALGNCLIAPACGLTGVLDEALAAFMAVLDRYTLADLLKKRSKLLGLFAAELAKTAA
jgi:Rrf2 family transcriptional regulator, nitric oxide-sensitive transcriptional repressor